jgi:hypothetical protein
MITSENKLLIFESFRFNNNLPKFNKVEKNNSIDGITIGGFTNGMTSVSGSFGLAQPMNEQVFVQDGFGNLVPFKQKSNKSNFITRLYNKIKNRNEEKNKTKTIVEFFSSLGKYFDELVDLTEIGLYYQEAINNAKSANQTALFDSLLVKFGVVKSESILISKNLKKYITEEQVVKFFNKTKKDKNLKLTWIENYVRPIPTDIIKLKNELDLLEVFDNYVVMHYDPQNNSTDLTEEEKIRKKDPILFGLIFKSNKLYYIGDWIDEYCDLTLEKLIETVKSKVNEINNESVKTFINQ